jgi:hypothetical protein
MAQLGWLAPACVQAGGSYTHSKVKEVWLMLRLVPVSRHASC